MTGPRAFLALVVLFLVGGMSACASGQDSAVDPDPIDREFQAETRVYQCHTSTGEITLVTRTRPNGLHLFLPPDGTEPYLDCTYDRRASIWEHAKLSGVDFRALGNEPGWVLEIREGERLDLSYDYGQGALSVPVDQVHTDPKSRSTVFSGSSGEVSMRVSLTGETCRDTMADEVYPTRVEVEFAGRKLKGCGRPLH